MSREEDLERRVRELEAEVASLRRGRVVGVRKRSEKQFGGLPLWEIALGPDPARGELRGHAKAVLAIGDMATGVVAIAGLARGIVAVGGLAVGIFSFGGFALGLALALGGAAIGTVAIGGGAAGHMAAGGGAVGQYACGGGAAGTYVVSPIRRDPEAEERFRQFGLGSLCAQPTHLHR